MYRASDTECTDIWTVLISDLDSFTKIRLGVENLIDNKAD